MERWGVLLGQESACPRAGPRHLSSFDIKAQLGADFLAVLSILELHLRSLPGRAGGHEAHEASSIGCKFHTHKLLWFQLVSGKFASHLLSLKVASLQRICSIFSLSLKGPLSILPLSPTA